MQKSIKETSRHGRKKFIAISTLVVTLLAASFQQESAEADEPRSLADSRYRRTDELDRPRYKERVSHRGFEVRTNQMVVISTNSLQEAHAVAKQIEAVWGVTANLGDHWSQTHRKNNFGLGSLVVFIDGQQARGRDRVELQFQENQSFIYVNTNAVGSSLEEQMPLLKVTAVEEFFHTSQWDRKLPNWVQQGMSTYIIEEIDEQEAKSNSETETKQAVANSASILTRERYFTRKRVTADRLQEGKLISANSDQRVRFLLEGNDALHTLDFFAALQQATSESRNVRFATAISRRSNLRPSSSQTTVFDSLMVARQGQYKQWLEDPQVDQPQWTVLKGASKQTILQQREMAWILKLTRRFSDSRKNTISVKIGEFGPAGVKEYVQPVGKNPYDLKSLTRRMSDPTGKPWTTLDRNGNLMFSQESGQIGMRLEIDQQRYRSIRRDNRWVLSVRLQDGQRLEGWIEENPDNPGRPLAKFKLRAAAE